MLLSDRDIHSAHAQGRLNLDPWTPSLVQPASVDIRLGDSFRVFNNHAHTAVDPAVSQDLTRAQKVNSSGIFVLHPGEFILGTTLEKVALDASLAARVEGKSSLGRLGLLTHATAGFIDPGFQGEITLELANVSSLPIILRAGMLIGQLCFMSMSSPAERPYGSPGLGSHYQGQVGATASRSGSTGV